MNTEKLWCSNRWGVQKSKKPSLTFLFNKIEKHEPIPHLWIYSCNLATLVLNCKEKSITYEISPLKLHWREHNFIDRGGVGVRLCVKLFRYSHFCFKKYGSLIKSKCIFFWSIGKGLNWTLTLEFTFFLI